MGPLGSIFGQKPVVPNLPKIDIGKEQQKAIANNINAAPEAGKLANLTRDQLEQMMRAAIPDFDKIRTGVSGNIADMVGGKLPQDVQDAIQRNAAARALGGGYSGSGMARNLVARDLGLTSLDMITKGQTAAESWFASMEQMMNPAMQVYTGMFLTPMQQYGADFEERNMKFQREWLANQVSAMPDPKARGVHDTVMSLVTAALGGSYGGYGPSGAPSGGGFGGGGFGGGGGVSAAWGSGYTPAPEGTFGGYDSSGNAVNYAPRADGSGRPGGAFGFGI